MTDPTAAGRASAIQRFLGGLRFPQLFAVLAALWFADLLIPDLIPFLDEIFLGVLTTMFGLWRKPEPPPPPAGPAGPGGKPPIKNITPRQEP